MPLVSIIVPVFNLEFYIERCLESLASQTLKNIEVLVVNDGATDDSQLIIEEYVQKNPDTFKSFIKPNGGHGSACNYGIDQAAGEYIMIVDGDDYLDPDTVEYMYVKARETKADLLIGNLLYCYTGSKAPFKPLPFEGERMLSDEDRALLYKNWATPCGRLYHRSIFADSDVRLREGIIFADANFAPKSYLVAKTIYYVDRELYNYDLTGPTQSMKQTDRRILDIIPALTDMLEFYKKKGAFERCREDLQRYTVMHSVAWIGKVGTLVGYNKVTALREIFAVPERYFGKNQWVRDEIIAEVFGGKTAFRLRYDRLFNYRSIVFFWHLVPFLRRIDKGIERLLTSPVFAYRVMKRLVWRSIHIIA